MYVSVVHTGSINGNHSRRTLCGLFCCLNSPRIAIIIALLRRTWVRFGSVSVSVSAQTPGACGVCEMTSQLPHPVPCTPRRTPLSLSRKLNLLSLLIHKLDARNAIGIAFDTSARAAGYVRLYNAHTCDCVCVCVRVCRCVCSHCSHKLTALFNFSALIRLKKARTDEANGLMTPRKSVQLLNEWNA